MYIMVVDPSLFTLGTKIVVSDPKTGIIVYATSIVDSAPKVVDSIFSIAQEHNVSKIFCDNRGIGLSIYDKAVEKTKLEYSNITVSPLK